MANEVTIHVKTKDDGGRGFSAQEKRAKGLKGTLGSLGGTFKATAGAALGFGALEVFKNSLKGASDLNEAVSKTNVVFGKSAADIHKWAQSTATSIGLSRSKSEEFAGSLGLIFTQMGSTTREAAKMSKAWVQLAADLGSFNNADPSEILDAMQSATRGEYDELQRYVPSVNAAAVEHEALAMSGKKSADQLTAHDRLLAVQKILFHDTAKAQGDFARTSTGAANSQKILSAQWEDAQAKLGKGLLPLLVKATRLLSKMIDFGTKNKSWLGPTILGLGLLAGSLKALALAQAAANIAAEANPYIRIATIVLALGAAFAIAWKKSQTFRNVMTDVAVTTAQVFIRMGQFIVGALLNIFSGVVSGFATIGAGILDALGMHGMADRLRNSAKMIQNWKDGVVDKFNQASDAVEGWGDHLKKAPKVAKLKGDITDLTSKLSKARADLKRTGNTKARAKATANINSLMASLDRARAALNRLNGFTADTYVRVHQQMIPTAGGLVRRASGRYAHGGIVGAAGGGPRSRMTLVGENGPELADLAPGTTVHSNPDTRRMLSQGGGQTGLIQVNLNLDGATIARALINPLKGEVRYRGGKGPNSVQKALGS